MTMTPESLEPGDGGYRPLAEINVTPLVDVMLVLLIIFMIAAPLLVSGVTLELPKAASEPLPEAREKLIVSITADRELYVDEQPVAWDAIADHLAARRLEHGDPTIFLRGDKRSDYGAIMELLALLGRAGFDDIALLTEEPQGAP